MEKIVITDHKHLRDIWHTMGLIEAYEILKDLRKKYPLPGLALAEATIGHKAEGARSRMTIENIRVALGQGFDLNTENLVLGNSETETWLFSEPADSLPESKQ